VPLAAAALPPQAPAKSKLQPPPGMILIEGGPTKVGSTVAYVEDLGRRNDKIFGVTARETPQHEVQVEDFFLMVTEVTNEQYAAFVQATGYRPPEHWAEQAIDAASLEFATKQGEEKEKAKAEGKPFEPRKFDRARWWRENWAGKAWSIPKGKETHPVVYVDYQDANAYARWAGLRLMTEFEYQRAGRGRTDNVYPWGNEPDPTRAAVVELRVGGKEMRLAAPLAVASLPGGATANGLYDLSGNVWEWTSSPFVQYPGYKDLAIDVGAGKATRKIHGSTAWDANQRVVVGGCYEQDYVAARLTTRRGTERSQSTSGMGFRCAASVLPGRDVANQVMRDDLPRDKRPEGAEFDVTKVLAADRWTSAAGTAVTPKKDGGTQPVASYGIVTGYDYVLFVPAVDIDTVTVKGLGELSHEKGTIPLGVLSTTRPVLEPALDRGTYLVAYRGAGAPVPPAEPVGKDAKEPEKRTIQEPAQQPAEPAAPAVAPFKAPPGFDHEVDALIFYAPDGEPKAWMPAPNLDYLRPVEPTTWIGSATRSYKVEKPDGMLENKQEEAMLLKLKVNSWVRVSNKGFTYTLPLYFKPGEIGADWRGSGK
jgi:formylglycine-generating enzyme required for sulfatase activity